MDRKKKIRVLIVDDSLVFRELLYIGLSKDPMLEVVAKAVDPFDARDKILKFEPDVMTCDVEMPKMNGIEFIKRLLSQYPLPTIVVSSVGDAVFEAMRVGAVDFVSKPNTASKESVENFITDMISKIKIAKNSKVIPTVGVDRKSETNTVQVDKNKVIAIGASTGGTEAINSILKQLPANQIPGIVIVQHIPSSFSKLFAERMDQQLEHSVKEAEDGDYIEPGKVLIAPGEKHMSVRKMGSKFKVDVFEGEKRNGHCPSVDILFESTAKSYGNKAIGVILTGMGYDGVKGLLNMKRKGAFTIGQDEKTSVVYGMPKAALEVGAVESQMPLEKIPQKILELLK